MKLYEIIGSGFMTDHDEILAYMERHEYDSDMCRFDSDGLLEVNGSIDCGDFEDLVVNGKLIIKFGLVAGDFDCCRVNLTSLEGFPIEVDSVDFQGNSVTSLVGIPRTIYGKCSFLNNKITSLVGISDLIDFIDGGIYFSGNPITEGGLGLLAIKGLDYLHFDSVGDSPAARAFNIIEQYLSTDNIIECQSELIEAGLEEFAQL